MYIYLYSFFVSWLRHFWRIHFFTYTCFYQPNEGLCQATCVQSHPRQPRSVVAKATCEVQVSAVDSRTVPTVATGVSKPLCYQFTLTFALASANLSLYIPIYYSNGRYTTMQPTLLTPRLQVAFHLNLCTGKNIICSQQKTIFLFPILFPLPSYNLNAKWQNADIFRHISQLHCSNKSRGNLSVQTDINTLTTAQFTRLATTQAHSCEERVFFQKLIICMNSANMEGTLNIQSVAKFVEISSAILISLRPF